MAEAHPENVPGPFYVEDGCCLSCGVPMDAAPDMFAWATNDLSCVVKRQPVTQAEVDRAIVAMHRSEVDCIRYRGSDPAIANRIARAGMALNCDIPPVDAHPLLRFRVRFGSRRSGDTPRAVADRLRTWLGRQPGPGWRIKPPRPWSPATAVFAWDDFRFLGMRAHFNSVRFHEGPDGFRASLHRGFAGACIGLGLVVHEWLTAELAEDVRWLAADEDWNGPGFHMPI